MINHWQNDDKTIFPIHKHNICAKSVQKKKKSGLQWQATRDEERTESNY